jgi:hypothetical protein
MSAHWKLITSDGRDLGTFEGASPREAIRAMLTAISEQSYVDDDTTAQFIERLVAVWGGRVVGLGSVPPPPEDIRDRDTMPIPPRSSRSMRVAAECGAATRAAERTIRHAREIAGDSVREIKAEGT